MLSLNIQLDNCNIDTILGVNSNKYCYFNYPLHFIHLFVSYLWIQLKTQANLLSRLDFSYIKANSQKLIIRCDGVLIADCQLQHILRGAPENDVNRLFWDKRSQKEGMRVSCNCPVYTFSKHRKGTILL